MSVQEPKKNFIREIIDEDIRNGKNGGRVQTRFPPEPNGFLHIGHAKSICLNFGLAADYHGLCNLRFDDTNPETEESAYVESIKQDVRWLGFDWEDREFYASDYFEQLYDYAIDLIKKGKAYVCDLSAEEISKLGRELHERLRTMAEHIARIGKGLDNAVKAYNRQMPMPLPVIVEQAAKQADKG
jgi:glutaminyl-tRNA synthetase